MNANMKRRLLMALLAAAAAFVGYLVNPEAPMNVPAPSTIKQDAPRGFGWIPDPQAVVAGKSALQLPDVAGAVAQILQGSLHRPARLRREAAEIGDDLERRPEGSAHSAMSASEPNFVRPSWWSRIACMASGLPMISRVSAMALMRS